MSYLDKLLEGVEVEWKPLSEIALISAAGVDKKIIKTENPVTLLNYMDVYRNPYLNSKIPTMQVTANDAKLEQCNVLKGDIFITPSSEVLNEIGFSAMAVEDMPDVVYSYHIMRIRLNEYNLTQSMFINYLFRSNSLQSQINKQAKGLTRFGLTKTQWENLLIPIPCPENPKKSLEIQSNIVRILDTFAEQTEVLTSELTNENIARNKQYKFYREQMFSFDKEKVQYLPLGDESIGKFIRGGGLQKKDFTETGVGCIHYGQIYTYYKTYTDKTKSFVSEEFAKKARMAKHGDVVIATTSENDEDVCKAVAWLGDVEIAVSSDACFYNHCLNPKYVAYFFQTEQFQKQKRPFITGTKVRRVNADDLAKIIIPVPSSKEQERIVTILDKFDLLTNSISEGLSKEIQLRKKQYEFYRDLLLTFPKNNIEL